MGWQTPVLHLVSLPFMFASVYVGRHPDRRSMSQGRMLVA
jgi:hypothetical protein